MPTAGKLLLALGALLAAAAVALGAFGAHALKARLAAEALALWNTAAQYHAWNALGLLAAGLACLHFPENPWLRAGGWLLAAGIVLFSGSLYALALTGERWIGALTPVGGTLLLAGWLAFACGALQA